MNLYTHLTLTELIIDLQKKGFNRTFEMKMDALYCLQTKRFYHREELQIVKYYRFEKNKNILDNRIIFVIQCADGEKGCLNAPSSSPSGIRILEFMDKVKIKPRNNQPEPL